MRKSDTTQFDVPCSSATMIASGAYMHSDPLAEVAPLPIYETRPIQKKEEPVSTPANGSDVNVMKLLDYDPNDTPIDVDRYAEEQKLMHDLGVRAEARLASFMDSCRKLREMKPEGWQIQVSLFTNNMVDLMFEGRPPLASTERHKATMKLVLRATLVNLVTSHDQENPQ